MVIYVTHSSNTDYITRLYTPLQESGLSKKHELIFPYLDQDQKIDSKDLVLEKKCDFVLAEVSFPSMPLGVELGWASAREIPIICIYKQGHAPSMALKEIATFFIEYNDNADMIQRIEDILA